MSHEGVAEAVLAHSCPEGQLWAAGVTLLPWDREASQASLSPNWTRLAKSGPNWPKLASCQPRASDLPCQALKGLAAGDPR